MAKELSDTPKKQKATKPKGNNKKRSAAQTATDNTSNIDNNINGARTAETSSESGTVSTNASTAFANKKLKLKLEENGADGSTSTSAAVDPEQNMSLVQFIPSKDENSLQFAEAFWKHQFDVAETIQEDFKTPELPLARVKRVMKTDPEVAMIASEVPVILEKACQIFIADLTARAYIDSPKRRTLTKVDVARAARQTDMFDFLIDILPFPPS